MWPLIVAAWAPVRLRTIITGVIGVPAFRCSVIIGTVTPGDGPAISAISCVCTTSSRHKRSGSGYKQAGKSEQAAGEAGEVAWLVAAYLSPVLACPAPSLGTRLPLTQ